MTASELEEDEINSWKKKIIGSWIFAIPIAILMLSERLMGIEFIPENLMIPLNFFWDFQLYLYLDLRQLEED